MERGSKRKAVLLASPAIDNRSSKKQKTPDSSRNVSINETAQSTTTAGYEFLGQLKAATDKSGRLISSHFITLPDKRALPEYYQQILLPIAIDTIETKLKRKEYPNLNALEADVKRMVANAKLFNEARSEVFLDAERIRKMTFNIMEKINPAHKDGKNHPLPTPVPENQIEMADVDIDVEIPVPPQRRLTLKKDNTLPRPHSRSASINQKSENTSQSHGDDTSYKGLTFQQAQEQILQDIIKYQDPASELEIFTPFVTLPSRTLTDYYDFIKNPQSLKGVLKKIQGFHSRTEITGVTDLKSWDAFESEMKKIWVNAREYNEDESDMYSLAGELETVFLQKLRTVKAVVDEPAQPTLKLNMPKKPEPIKLRLGSHKASPAPSGIVKPPISLPSESSAEQVAIQRQKALIQNSANGHASSDVQSKPPVVALNNGIRSPHMPNGVTTERLNTLPNGRPNSQSGQVRPHMNGYTPLETLPNGYPAMPSANTPTQSHVPFQVPPPTGFDNKWRAEGKDASSALMSNIHIATHPELHVKDPLSFDVFPDSDLCQKSATWSLPPTHALLRLTVDVPAALGGQDGRPYRLYFTANGQRMREIRAGDHTVHSDVKLITGTNRIEVECVAAGAGANGKTTNDLEMEKMSIYVNLRRFA